jgi:glycosyltransferase involved in cell wall biosynthesis
LNENCDVLIVGSLINADLVLAEHLSRAGLRVCVARKQVGEREEPIRPYTGFHTHFDLSNIHRVRNSLDFLKLARSSRLVVSLTGALINHLSFLWPLRRWLGLPPVFHMSTGSDITELAVAPTLKGRLFRQYLRFTQLNIMPAYPRALSNIQALQVPNVVFLPFCYFLPELDDEESKARKGRKDSILFFHPSHLDWKQEKSDASRNSSKGNDRFIRAFARAVKGGLDARCLILDRGPDREHAKRLIDELGVADRFTWKPHLSRDELVESYLQADVVVDQFDVGGIGAIAIEAMYLGKPVMIYINEASHGVSTPDPPPVLNARTEEEIYAQIKRCAEPEFLASLGERARAWVKLHYDWKRQIAPFLFYYSLYTGHRIVDYGWDFDPDTA